LGADEELFETGGNTVSSFVKRENGVANEEGGGGGGDNPLKKKKRKKKKRRKKLEGGEPLKSSGLERGGDNINLREVYRLKSFMGDNKKSRTKKL